MQCRRGEGSGAKYGAIAFSPSTNAWGDSYRHGSRAEAERRALAPFRLEVDPLQREDAG